MGNVKTTLRKEGASRTDLHYIEPEKIVVDWDENPRKDYGNDEEMDFLINSISMEGVKVPVKVYSKGGKLHLAHGFRRMKATLIAIERGANVEKIPAQQVANNMETILIDHFTLNSGKPLSVVEQSNALIELMKKTGMSQAEAARRIGLSKPRVNVLVNFGDKASTPVKKAVQDGVIGFDTATRLIRDTEGIEEQNDALEKAINITSESDGTPEGDTPKKRRASLTAVKKATGSHVMTPFERLVAVGDKVQHTEFGETLNKVLHMARNKRDVEKIANYLLNGVED